VYPASGTGDDDLNQQSCNEELQSCKSWLLGCGYFSTNFCTKCSVWRLERLRASLTGENKQLWMKGKATAKHPARSNAHILLNEH